jgi:hypothetical protein
MMQYKKLKVEELINICITRGLSSNGRKDILVQRLIDLDSKEDGIQLSMIDYQQQEVAKLSTQKGLFLHLKAQNLSRYFNAGIIYPLILEESEIYLKENRKTDILTKFPQHLILSTNPLNEFNEDDVLVELIIDDLDLKQLDAELFYSSDPIPISRIKNLYFKTASIIKSYLASIKIFPDSYIAEDLCKVLPFSSQTLKVDLSDYILPENNNLKLWNERLLKFDKLMGLLSFMKNAGVFGIKSHSFLFEEYNSSFLNVLSLINSNIQPVSKDIALYRYILFPQSIEITNSQRQVFKKIIDYIYLDIDFSFSLLKNILHDIKNSPSELSEDKSELDTILAAIEKVESHKLAFKELLKIDILRKNYPILCLIFLARYPNRTKTHTDKQAVRNQFILNEANLPKNANEFILSVLGLYYGYKSMIKEDTNIVINDIFISNIARQVQSIKFKLKSTFERVIIQSIFDFCKTDNTISSKYQYLNFKTSNNIKNTISNQHDYIDKSFDLFNTKILVFERLDKSVAILQAINDNYPLTLNSNSTLLHYLISNFGVTRELVKEIVKANSNRLNAAEILALINFEKGRNKS